MLQDELLEGPERCLVLGGMGSTKVVLERKSRGAETEVVQISGSFSFPHRSEFTSRDSQSSDKQILNIYDLCNKFIAYSTVFEDVVDVLAEWGSLYVLTRDGRVHALQEKDTQTKLEARPPDSQSRPWAPRCSSRNRLPKSLGQGVSFPLGHLLSSLRVGLQGQWPGMRP